MNKNNIFLLSLLLLLSLNLISAVPPFQQSTEGLQVEYQKIDTTKAYTSHQLNVHAYNQTGYPLTNETTDCYIEAYAPNGITVIEEEMLFDGHSWYYDLPGTNKTPGRYAWSVHCNDSATGGFISGPAYVTPDGLDPTLTDVAVRFVLLIFFVLLIMMVYHIRNRTDFDKWLDNIIKKYETRNLVKMVLSAIGYNLMKQTFIIYYMIGFPIVLMLQNTAWKYNLTAITGMMDVLLYIYTWGFIFVGLVFLSYLQEFIMKMLDMVKNMEWGFEK